MDLNTADVEQTPKLNDTVIDKVVNERVAKWKGAVELELQTLVGQAAKLREHINGAKTTTKKQYFTKKFSKVRTQVVQMVTALERITAQEKASQVAVNETAEPAVA